MRQRCMKAQGGYAALHGILKRRELRTPLKVTLRRLRNAARVESPTGPEGGRRFAQDSGVTPLPDVMTATGKTIRFNRRPENDRFCGRNAACVYSVRDAYKRHRRIAEEAFSASAVGGPPKARGKTGAKETRGGCRMRRIIPNEIKGEYPPEF